MKLAGIISYGNRRCRFKIGTVHGPWYSNASANYDIELEIGSITGGVSEVGYLNTGDFGYEAYTIAGHSTLTGTFIGIKIGEIHGSVPASWATQKNVVGTLTFIGGTSSAPFSIGASAFSYNTKLKKVDMSEAFVTTIGATAFQHCYELTTFNMGDHVTSWGDNVINECRNLKSLVLSPTLSTVTTNALQGSYLESVTLGRLCLSIGENAFRYLPTKFITINEGLTTIGNGAFREMPHLRHINLPTTVKNIPANCFYMDTELEEVDIESEDLNNIGNLAFGRCDKLTTIDLPPTTKFEAQAFYMCHNINHLDIHKGSTFVETSLQGSTNVRFADDFDFDDSEVTSLNMSNSSYTYDNVLEMLYTLPQRSTTFSITITPTYYDTCTNSSYGFWYNLSRKYIKVVGDGLEFCESSDPDSMLVASYVSNKGYSIS